MLITALVASKVVDAAYVLVVSATVVGEGSSVTFTESTIVTLKLPNSVAVPS